MLVFKELLQAGGAGMMAAMYVLYVKLVKKRTSPIYKIWSYYQFKNNKN